MTHLEQRLGLNEDLEIIEDAISQRLQRNPELYYSSLDKLQSLCHTKVHLPPSKQMVSNKIYRTSKPHRSSKQVQAQMHEMRLFLDDYYRKLSELNKISKLPQNESSNEDKLEQLKLQIDNIQSNDKLVSNLEPKTKEYAMKSGPTTILSVRAAGLHINDIFNREEQYGEYMDLEPLHSEWVQASKNTECTLLQYLSQFECFMDKEEYLKKPPMDRKSSRYMDFVKKLSLYIEGFFHRKYCIIDKTVATSHLQHDFKDYISKPLDPNDTRLFCVVCSKHFKGEAVFENHTKGKPHLKQLNKRSEELFAEYKLHKYLSLLRDEFTSTKTLIERKQAFTAQERMEEIQELDSTYNAPTCTPDDDDNDEEEDSQGTNSTSTAALGMPVGPDGVPMPFWLYKLQGLDVNYTCEICGNESFQGRRQFLRHFHDPKHQYRLRCLGIEPSATFNGIATIHEAQELQNSLANTTTNTTTNITIANTTSVEEVEDREGNVLSHEDFLELQRQGLL
ncbi:similar to Saccharomyces cerevisiae YDL030W PRP9 Subunit of the SF3a splicing factor complex, required for spliceosome assembly [Maudiozyma barnettii]|uniref:Similar to Saccharomyces cerevisiae YDL030W PRP9 Subunit of the SF3a splicing factor complex, required for spliceosome assembly n=1 Tax=Maudiozyma barnettii TaxID=61262 RepID=A0A8H2VK13_9SACH|nr:SF3a splicing factor complex subunit PRP9 [Kazachstania barnettii]CAB4257201.1 similar to Saccharomyces cerevisiae YDL030W PRP9 Subunit of the SF3a splicing factor complex, required for spliceosome assembly [Kazachstania barnettii]CAD1779571.1 similar to Saccharomyces cerevisiae YDL030W PRP9 Subunit of the SF3a splicing factor complex, required for spliceosome assembly [Kazachstania barnettii]